MGAGAIALAPVSPVVPSDLQAAATAAVSEPVQLAASVNPVAAYFELIETTAGNIGGLAEAFLANPAPILTQVFLNQYATAGEVLAGLETFVGDLFSNFQTIAAPELEQAFELIGSGNFTGAAPHLVAALFQPALFAALPLLPVLQSAMEAPVANLLAVTQQFETIVAFAGIGLLGPLSSSVYATAEAIQNVVDAASAGDPIGALGAIIAAPAIVIDGFLNGFGVDGGLLSGGLGTFNVFLQIRDMIAAAITPAAPEAVTPAEATDVPAEDSLTVALSTSTDEAASVENVSSQGAAEASGGGGDVAGAPGTADEAEAEESSGEEETDGTETDGTEEDGTEEDATGEEEGEEDPGKPGGGTDLSDGNMATPGGTDDSGDESTDDDATDDTAPSDEGTDDAGSDGDSSDGGADGGGAESGGDTE
ncbi:hypothetical protein BHQ18_15675 [Mycolicibacterium flavescens]|uniref:PE-PGRS family protein n=1 Tax=Mycolicibacterium flavescens TaxID=1776 RepID=A0A1E3RHQ8_MYCFV|nr:hypothetical protein BHQ18_15675 [Mycolicibacterium flavescens]